MALQRLPLVVLLQTNTPAPMDKIVPVTISKISTHVANAKIDNIVAFDSGKSYCSRTSSRYSSGKVANLASYSTSFFSSVSEALLAEAFAVTVSADVVPVILGMKSPHRLARLYNTCAKPIATSRCLLRFCRDIPFLVFGQGDTCRAARHLHWVTLPGPKENDWMGISEAY